MSYLINRVPTGRIISLHTELRYLEWKFKDSSFTLTQMKFDSSSNKTQLDFFPLSVTDLVNGRFSGKYDPYLDNPRDLAGFHLTQSIQRDSQKSKSVSECFNALEGLGWVNRLDDGKGVISLLGHVISGFDYSNHDLLPLFKRSMLNYGPFVGFISECLKYSSNDVFRREDIVIGYVDTGEELIINNQSVPISIGSQGDSITRTRSALIAWAMTAGFIWPVNVNEPADHLSWHVEALKLLEKKKWPWNKFKILLPNDYFQNSKILVAKPLEYRSMTKSTKSLRERGQSLVRSGTIGVERKVKNRRFIIIFALALAYSLGKKVDYKMLIQNMLFYPEYFVISTYNFEIIMDMELNIAIASGLLYTKDQDYLIPITGCERSSFTKGLSQDELDLMNKICNLVIK